MIALTLNQTIYLDSIEPAVFGWVIAFAVNLLGGAL